MEKPQGISVILIALIAFGVISTAHAGDIAAGKEKVLFVCSECHGMTGISDVENFPNLAGQKEMYLTNQLKAFKSGKRNDEEMTPEAKQLTDADIVNVAAYYASLQCSPKREER